MKEKVRMGRRSFAKTGISGLAGVSILPFFLKSPGHGIGARNPE